MRFGIAAVALALIALVPLPVSAYIVVLKNGTYVDVGDAYRIAGSQLEYRTPGGGTRSISLHHIDFEGTEMMNGESIDVFVSRASRTLIRNGSAAPAPNRERPRRAEPPTTVTNATLEPYRIEREKADAEYRARNPRPPEPEPEPEPPPAYRARSSEAALDVWRAEARVLRDQLAAEEAQIEVIQVEIAYREANPLQYQLNHRYNYGRNPVYVDPYGYVYPTGPSRADEEMSQLSSRLVDIQIQHQATLVRWESFLERARRAGVPPGVIFDY